MSKTHYRVREQNLSVADTATITRYVQDLRNVLSDSSLPERKSFTKSSVKEVRVKGDKALLNYTIPLSPRGLTSDISEIFLSVQMEKVEEWFMTACECMVIAMRSVDDLFKAGVEHEIANYERHYRNLIIPYWKAINK